MNKSEEKETYAVLTFEEASVKNLRKWWMDFNDKGETWFMAMIYKRLQAQNSAHFIDTFMNLSHHCENAKQRFREMRELIEIVEL